MFICTGTVGTVGRLVPAILCLCTNMLLVLHRYCTGTALYMYWYCGYCWYTGTSHSISVYQYVTGAALVLLFICTGTVGTVGTLVPATLSLDEYATGTALVLLFICIGTVGTVGTLVPAILCLCTNMLLVLHWYQPLYFSVPICYWYCTGTALYMYWYCGYCWYTGTCHSMSLYQYVTGTALVLIFICTGTVGTVGTLVPATQCLCAYMLLVLHWYRCLYVLVLWVPLVHEYQQLYVSMPICYWYHAGTAVYMYWNCCLYVLVLLVPATLCLCA